MMKVIYVATIELMKQRNETICPAIKFTNGSAPLTTLSGARLPVSVLFFIGIVLLTFGSPGETLIIPVT